MGKVRIPGKAFLFCGLLYATDDLFEKARTALEELFGPVCREARGFPFTVTDYYRDELGEEIYKGFLFFDRFISMESIADIKIETNGLEKELSPSGEKRIINLDPGYLDLAKVVLATTKDRAHRLYLKDGIYGEVEYTYQKDSYVPSPWAYPDYYQESYIILFNEMRRYYHNRLRSGIS
ncbi:DUF4416 family protein [Candidatus Mcinerneyibacteriota bacterium]|nr:DUF4416 family protein [Candidatus Mcinerneyibacteriota bacterium]